MKKRPQVEIYTDGACAGNPGPGGWAAVLKYQGKTKEISGFAAWATNQQMELRAAVEALKALKVPCRVKLYSDSAYLINAFQKGWVRRWVDNGWLTAKRHPVENQELWKELVELACLHDVEWIKVPGHSWSAGNNRADELARQALQRGLAEGN